MKIAIDARGTNLYKGTGIGTYTQALIKNLLELDNKNQYILYWCGNGYKDFKKQNSEIILSSKKHQRFFEVNYFPYYNYKEKIDIYHVPQNGLGIEHSLGERKICTIHDLIPYLMPETVGKGYLKSFLRKMPQVIEKSNSLITVSNYSKEDIMRFFPWYPEEDIYVTPLAAKEIFKPLDKIFCSSKLKELFKIDKPYILYLGGFSPRKNVRGVINSFKKIYKNLKDEHYLVIGGALRDEGEALYNEAMKSDIKDKIKFLGYLEEEQLPYLYNNCSVFIYPSFYEGFGLPPLEAMSCGAPVITSNTTSIPEVIGDSGILVNPWREDELSEALVKVINNLELRLTLSRKGLERSNEFSWNNTAIKTLEVYNSVKIK